MLRSAASSSSTSAIAAASYATASSAALQPTGVYIASVARTPITTFQGSLGDLSAPTLGAHVVKSALERAKIKGDQVDEVYMGNVLSANVGQAPARQAALGAGLPPNVVCTTINKVCASGMKATMLGAMSISLGINKVVVVGGMESMTMAPYYIPKGRGGYRYGHGELLDGVLKDGLTDAYDGTPMGMAAEACAKQYNIGRAEQDAFCLSSYDRAAAAIESGAFKAEIAPITVKTRAGTSVIEKDEEPFNVKRDKIPSLKPVFMKDGTVTAANASSLNDGASALILVSGAYASANGIKPLARIVSYADAEKRPIEFTTAPAAAVPIAIKRAGLTAADIDFYEINEAFSVVALVNMQLLNIPHSKINVNGGAVALGHPIGSSGSRIIGTLTSVLAQQKGRFGVAAICNGGGGASAVVVENLQ